MGSIGKIRAVGTWGINERSWEEAIKFGASDLSANFQETDVLHLYAFIMVICLASDI